ncbi:MAG: aldehyde dehydrogenase [Planctomycetes bacterium]|nr:aldehyde dehydrogenase [Planctomycetota bacterium]
MGVPYESLDRQDVKSFREGDVLARVSQANAGLIRRDLRKLDKAAAALRALSVRELLDIARKAGELFMTGTLPLNAEGATQTPEEYVRTLSRTSGLPHVLCRRNMEKVHTVFTSMEDILRGLTRGMDLSVIDEGIGDQGGVPVCYVPTTSALGVILPSNSPGVNSIWMPAIALKTPVILKPGREEPWTPLRIMQAFLAAGCPPEAFSFYPTDHEGADVILTTCGRAQLFGDERVTKKYAHLPGIELHGPGRSKVLLDDAQSENWREHLPVLVQSVAANGGRSCVNASAIFVTKHADEIADALARELAAIEPTRDDDEHAVLSAFANAAFAEFIDQAIEQGLKQGGAEDVTAKHRTGDRKAVVDGATYLRPTVVRCRSLEHPLANTEFLFPFASVVELPQDQMLDAIGPSLVVSGITRDEAFRDALIDSPHIDRLNLGPVPTTRVDWDQPHEGNLFETLYKRRAIHRAEAWTA